MHFIEEHPMHCIYTLYLKTSGQELEPYHINISLLIVKTQVEMILYGRKYCWHV